MDTLAFLNREVFGMIDNSVSMELLARLLASEQGGRKLVGNRRFSVVLNQADAPARIAAGEQTLALLRKKYEVQGVLTYFDERERA